MSKGFANKLLPALVLILTGTAVFGQFTGDVVDSRQVLEQNGIDTESFVAIEAALASPSSSKLVQENAAAFLAKSDFTAAGAALARAIGNENEERSRTVIRVMHEVRSADVMDALREIALSNRGLSSRSAAVTQLARNGDRETLRTIATTTSIEESLRTKAIYGHTFVWKQEDEAMMSWLLGDPEVEVAAAAAIVLSNKAKDFPVSRLIDIAVSDSLSTKTVRRLTSEVFRRSQRNSENPRSASELQKDLRRKGRADLLRELELIKEQGSPMPESQ